MRENRADRERLLKQWVSTYRCQHCRRGFEHSQVRVTARHEQVWLVSVRCSLCRKHQLFCVALKDAENIAVPDLTDDESERFAQMEPVGGDEVIDVHEFLRDFDGDFKALFGD